MNKQNFISELDKSCDLFRESYTLHDKSLIQQRDELISFAKASVIAQIAPLSEAQQLAISLRENISMTAGKNTRVAA